MLEESSDKKPRQTIIKNVTLNDIFKASGNSMMLTEKVDWVLWGTIAVIFGGGAYVYERIMFCQQRAYEEEAEYYINKDKEVLAIYEVYERDNTKVKPFKVFNIK